MSWLDHQGVDTQVFLSANVEVAFAGGKPRVGADVGATVASTPAGVWSDSRLNTLVLEVGPWVRAGWLAGEGPRISLGAEGGVFTPFHVGNCEGGYVPALEGDAVVAYEWARTPGPRFGGRLTTIFAATQATVGPAGTELSLGPSVPVIPVCDYQLD